MCEEEEEGEGEEGEEEDFLMVRGDLPFLTVCFVDLGDLMGLDVEVGVFGADEEEDGEEVGE